MLTIPLIAEIDRLIAAANVTARKISEIESELYHVQPDQPASILDGQNDIVADPLRLDLIPDRPLVGGQAPGSGSFDLNDVHLPAVDEQAIESSVRSHGNPDGSDGTPESDDLMFGKVPAGCSHAAIVPPTNIP